MDSMVCQGLKAAVVLQARLHQDLLGILESEVVLVKAEMLEIR